MQWSDDDHAGFTAGEPWIPVNPDYEAVNVADARRKDDSIWHYYRELIDLRHDRDVLVYGSYDLLLPDDPDVYAFLRTLGDKHVLVVLNFQDGTPTFSLPPDVEWTEDDDADLLAGNYAVDGESPDSFELRPYEARVYELA